jgi:hypothetical protein
MFGIRATWVRDFNTKNTFPWYDNEVWIPNLEVYLPIHRKCQFWSWFCKYIKTVKHLERPDWFLDTLHDVHDRIQLTMWPRINSTNKTGQTIAKIENVPNRKTGSCGSKIVCKGATVHDVGGWVQPISLIGTPPEPLESNETFCVVLVRVNDFTLGVHHWLESGQQVCAVVGT